MNSGWLVGRFYLFDFMDEETGLLVGDVEAVPSLKSEAENTEQDGDFLHDDTSLLFDFQ